MTRSIDRRAFLAVTAAAATSVAAAPALAAASAAAPQAAPAPPAPASGPFTLPPLPYPADALEPSIDAETMRIHHGKHHQAYVTNLNNALKGDLDGFAVPASVDELITKLSELPAEKVTAVRNNGGGHANHTLFWSTLAPKGQGGEPSKELLAAIERDLGGLDKVKELMTAAGMSRFGSGWSWLVVTPEKKLVVTSTANQDSPLMGKNYCDKPGTPIFGIDVWEHAYYLKYQNRRAEYVQAIWDIVNWNEVSKRFASATG